MRMLLSFCVGQWEGCIYLRRPIGTLNHVVLANKNIGFTFTLFWLSSVRNKERKKGSSNIEEGISSKKDKKFNSFSTLSFIKSLGLWNAQQVDVPTS